MNIDFDKMQGLVPAIVQDAATDEILMLGFMNSEAWEKTQQIGYVTFYSRTRNELWTKGETSGNRLRVISVATDCDCDSLLIKVEVEGEGMVCHEGTRSCFTKTTDLKPSGGAPPFDSLRSLRAGSNAVFVGWDSPNSEISK